MLLPPKLTAQYAFTGIRVAVAAALLAGSVGCAVVQTVRLEGFRLWPISITGWKARAETAEAALVAVAAGQARNRAEQVRVNEAAEQVSRDISAGVDINAQNSFTTERGRAERFIAGGGVRSPATSGDSGRPCTAPLGNGAGSVESASGAPVLDGDGPRADGLVLVYPEDIRICTDNTIKAEAAHDYATKIEAAF